MIFNPELASATTIGGALHLGEIDLPSDSKVTPLLVNHAATANRDDALIVQSLKPSLVFVQGITGSVEASSSIAAGDQVSDLWIFSHSYVLLT